MSLKTVKHIARIPCKNFDIPSISLHKRGKKAKVTI